MRRVVPPCSSGQSFRWLTLLRSLRDRSLSLDREVARRCDRHRAALQRLFLQHFMWLRWCTMFFAVLYFILAAINVKRSFSLCVPCAVCS